jgi:CubicO group peptidase (beta-lactamase class C family)
MDCTGDGTTRRDVVRAIAIGTAACMVGDGGGAQAAQPSQRLPRCAPDEVGIESAGVLRFLDRVDEKVGGLHSFMLVRHGKVAAEGWWRPYGPRMPHMLFSLSKSFTSTAIGIAQAEGRLSIEDRVLSFFPDQAPARPDKNLAAMKLRHLLSMATGHAEDTLGRTARDAGDWVQAFLSLPVEHEPGAPFVYNSGATYMLSAVIQKVTGMRLLDYLKPRLFAPLGIRGMTWQTCPKGINTGGWGLSVKTEDIARFGQLYLQKGLWNGRRIVPEAWVDEATSKRVPNGSDPNSDWAQGYGYQFWRCRHGAYRGDGAFGQYCVVMPEQDAVIAITSGVADMQAVLNAIWDCLLPAMRSDRTAPRGDAGALRRRLGGLQVPSPAGQAGVKARPGSYRMDANEGKVTRVRLAFAGDRAELTLTNDRGDHTLTAGLTDWVRGTTAIEAAPPARVAVRAAWTDPTTLTMTVCFTETPFVRTLTARFTGDDLVLTSKVNVGFGPTESPAIRGKLAR